MDGRFVPRGGRQPREGVELALVYHGGRRCGVGRALQTLFEIQNGLFESLFDELGRVVMGEIESDWRGPRRSVLKRQGGGPHPVVGSVVFFGTVALAFGDAINVLVNPVPLFSLEAHEGLQLLSLFASSLAQFFQSLKGFTCHWVFVAKSQEIQIHMEAEGQRNFKLVKSMPVGGRQGGRPHDVVEVPVDLSGIVAVLVASRETGISSGH